METPTLAARSFDMLPLRQKDAGAMFSRWMTDKEVAKFMPWFPHKDVDETHQMVTAEVKRNQEDDYYSWGLFFDDFSHGVNRPRIFGQITLTVDRELQLGSISYNLMRSEWGKGYATEAVSEVISFALGLLGLKYVSAACHADNKASCRVLEKVGMQRQYEFRSRWKTGGKVLMVRYQVTYDQYYADDPCTEDEE